MGNLAVGGIACLLVTGAHAQIDEIQVYDADINSPGQFSVQLHNNYTPIGRKLPDFEGRIAPNHTLNGVPEWAYGVVEWLELGVDELRDGRSPTMAGVAQCRQGGGVIGHRVPSLASWGWEIGARAGVFPDRVSSR